MHMMFCVSNQIECVLCTCTNLYCYFADTFSNGEPAKQQTGDEKQNIIDLTLDTPLQGRHKQHKSLA